MTYDPTILTKWGRITTEEWFLRRRQEELDRWLGPEQLHYVLTRTPYHDANGNEIIDWEFRRLLETDPNAANEQLEREFIADRNWVAINLRRRAEQKAAERKAAATDHKPARRQRRRQSPTHTQIPLI